MGKMATIGGGSGLIVTALLQLACGIALATGTAAEEACGKPEFEAVVEGAAATLRELNSRNKTGFQAKLRTLKDKRGWSTDQFMAEAAVYVQDERISLLDNRSNELLARLNSMGEAGASAARPDCNLLGELRGTMQALVETQTEKWTYMFAKLDKALGP